MSELRTNRIVPRDGLTSGTFGGIIQVVQTVKQDYQTININEEDDIISASINLKHASSKVMISWSMTMGRGPDDYGYLKLFEGSSEITGASGNTATGNQLNALAAISNRGAGNDQHFTNVMAGTYIHTPSSTSPTIKIKGKCTYGSTIHVNGPHQLDSQPYVIKCASFLQLYELAG